MAKLVKSHSNYVLRNKHQLTNNGTIYERDITTIGGRDNFAPGQVPVYKSGNFVITVNNDDRYVKNYTASEWEKNPDGNIWTLDNIKEYKKDEVASHDLTINIKKDYYNLADFAYYGSCAELIRTSINNIIASFPGELYAPFDNNHKYTHYYTETVYIPETDENGDPILDESGNTVIKETTERRASTIYYNKEDADAAGYDENDDDWVDNGVIGGTRMTYTIRPSSKYDDFAISFGYIPQKDEKGNYQIDNDRIVIERLSGETSLSLLDNPFGIDIHSKLLPKDYKEEDFLKYFANEGYKNYNAVDKNGKTYSIGYQPIKDAKEFIDVTKSGKNCILTNNTHGNEQHTAIKVVYEISGTVMEETEVIYDYSDEVIINPTDTAIIELPYSNATFTIISADYMPCAGDKLGEVVITIYEDACELETPFEMSFDYAGESEKPEAIIASNLVLNEKDRVTIKVYVGSNMERLYFVDDTGFESAYFFSTSQSTYNVDRKFNIKNVMSLNEPNEYNTVYKYSFRPKKEFYDKFINDLSLFEKVLMNTKSSPLYTATFKVMDENEFGYYDTLQTFTFPTTYGGYNIGSNGPDFTEYVSKLSKIGNFYDEHFSDNLYRSLTHESIKNFDWTRERRLEEDEEAIEEGANRISKVIRLFGREFDEIKNYADAISFIYTISYNDVNNIADYFFTDKLDADGWDLTQITPLSLYEYAGEDPYTQINKEGSINQPQKSDETSNTYNGKTLYRQFSQANDLLIKPYDKSYDVWENGYFYGCGDIEQYDDGTCVINVDPSGLTFSGRGEIYEEVDVTSTVDIVKSPGFGKFDSYDVSGETIEIKGDYYIDAGGNLRNRIRNYRSDVEWTMPEVNNEFMKRLAINSKYIWRHKGTIESIEMMLGMFGMKSKQWYNSLPKEEKKKYRNYWRTPYDFEVKEYTSFTKRIRDPWNILYDDYTYDYYNAAKDIAYDTDNYRNGIYDSYRGLTVGYRYSTDTYENKKIDGSVGKTNDIDAAIRDKATGEPIKTRYLYPLFQKGEIYDGDVYYQMNGGWINKSPYGFDNDNNIIVRNNNMVLNKETLRNIKSVHGVNDLFSIPIQMMRDGDVFHVEDTSEIFAIVDGIPYKLYTDSNGTSSYYYIEVPVENGYVVVGHAYFYDYVVVSTPYTETKQIRYDVSGGDYDGVSIRIYLMENGEGGYTINAYSEDTTISTFTLYENTEDNVNFFKINNRDYANEMSEYGWQQLTKDSDEYHKINSIINYYNGNNPHAGNFHYDNGHEYLTYFRRIFKNSYDNGLIDFGYLGLNIDEEEEVGKIGFHGIIRDDQQNLNYDDFLVEDTKIHYFGNYVTKTFTNEGGIVEYDDYTNEPYYYYDKMASSSYTYNTEHVENGVSPVGSDEDEKNALVYTLESIHPNRNAVKWGEKSQHYGESYGFVDNEDVDGVTNQIINNKRISIIFYLRTDNLYNSEGITEVKYIDSVIMPYVEQMLPSGVICDVIYKYFGEIIKTYNICGADEEIEGQPVKFETANGDWKTVGYIEQGKCTIKIDSEDYDGTDTENMTYNVKVGEESETTSLYLSDNYIDINYEENEIVISAYTGFQKIYFVTDDDFQTKMGTVASNGKCLTFKTMTSSATTGSLSVEIASDISNMLIGSSLSIVPTDECSIITISANTNEMSTEKTATMRVKYNDEEDVVTITQSPDLTTVDYSVLSNDFALTQFEFRNNSNETVASGDIITNTVFATNGNVLVDSDGFYSYKVTYIRPKYNSESELTVIERGTLKDGDVEYNFGLLPDELGSFNMENAGGEASCGFIASKFENKQEYIDSATSLVWSGMVSANTVEAASAETSSSSGALVTSAVTSVSSTWLHPSITDNGNANFSLSITGDNNPSATERTGYVIVSAYDNNEEVGSFTVDVIQGASTYEFSFIGTPDSVSSTTVSYERATLSFNNIIKSTLSGKKIDYSVKTISVPWVEDVSINQSTSAVTLTVSRNSMLEEREGYIIFKQKGSGKELKLIIKQEKTVPQKFDVYYYDGKNRYFADPTVDESPGGTPIGIVVKTADSRGYMRLISLSDAMIGTSTSYKYTDGKYHDSDFNTGFRRASNATDAISQSYLNGKEQCSGRVPSHVNDFKVWVAMSNYSYSPYTSKGQWYIPTMGELSNIFDGSPATAGTVTKINQICDKLRVNKLPNKMFSSTVIRNHSQHEDFPWILSTNNGMMKVVSQDNDDKGTLRPFIMLDSNYSIVS